MRKILLSLIVIAMFSCEKDENIHSQKNPVKMVYKGYLEEILHEDYKTITLPNVSINRIEEEISETEKINLLKIVGTSISDDSYLLFTVYADSVGISALYENEFDFRTPEGTPYNFSDVTLNVLVNNESEFEAEFSGRLRHYNQIDIVYIYLYIESGYIKYNYN